MTSIKKDVDLEDGEINDLEDGEIADDDETEIPPQISVKDEFAQPSRQNPTFHCVPRSSRSGRTTQEVNDFMPSYMRTYPRREQDCGSEEWAKQMRVRPSFHTSPTGSRNNKNHYGGGSWQQPSNWSRSSARKPLPTQQYTSGLSPGPRPHWQRGPSPAHLSSHQKPLSPPREGHSTVETPSDDFDLLLERHKLIQQQLEALEKEEEEAAALEEEIIDESFVDIPVEDLKDKKLDSNVNNQRSRKESNEEKNNVVNNNDVSNSNSTRSLSNSKGAETVKDKPLPKAFSPFKIKPLRPPVPSLKELSNKQNYSTKELEAKQSLGAGDALPRTRNDGNAKTGQQTSKRKRRRVRKRKPKERMAKAQPLHPKESVPVPSLTPVDAHSELEERLLTLAVTPLELINTSATQRDEVENRQKKRRERLRQWQLSHPGGDALQRGPSPGRRKGSNAYDQDDYLEAPMDVESDSADGPMLPLIEESGTGLPPPPPPLPGEAELRRLQEQQFAGLQPYNMFQGQPPQIPPPNLYGFYPPGQLMYSDWTTGEPPNHPTLQDEPGAEMDQSAPSSQYIHDSGPKEQDGASDDEASMLREILLKSVAKKRAAKSSADSKETKSASAPASPSQPFHSPLLLKSSEKSIAQTTSKSKEASPVNSKNARKPVSYTAPQHSPLVIQLGVDSDDSDDDDYYDNRHRQSGGGGMGFFGNLDQMIKQARESVEASKVKSDSGNEQESAAVPKTPDALQHLPEQHKAEYRLLKEQLAQREGQRRQPLADVNQGKEKEIAKSGEVMTRDKNKPEGSRELSELQEKAVKSEQKLAAHRQVLESDRSMLTKLTNLLTKKTSLLESQEERIEKLKAQLSSAETAAASSRSVVKRLHAKATVVKERIRKKLTVISDAEEEHLRAKSLLSAARRNPGLYKSGVGGAENQQTALKEESVGMESIKRSNEEAAGSLSPQNVKRVRIESPKSTRKQAIAERIALEKARLRLLEKQLADKLRDYNRTSDSELSSSSVPADGGVRGAHANDSDIVTQGAQALVPVRGAHANDSDIVTQGAQVADNGSTSGNKAGMASQRLPVTSNVKNLTGVQGAQRPDTQKALDKEGKETQLSDRTKQTFSDTNNKGNTEVIINTTTTSNSEIAMTTEAADPMETETSEVDQLNATRKDAKVDKQFNVSDKQQAYINKLQHEKERKGPVFPDHVTEVPRPAHRKAVLCVFMRPGSAGVVVSRDKLAWLVEKRDKAVNKAPDEEENFEGPTPLTPYASALLYFKSYRLSPYFRTKSSLPLSSLTFSNKIMPRVRLCKFDIQGVCNDKECPYQHLSDYKLSQTETLRDLAAYISEKKNKEGKDVMEKKVQGLVDSFVKQYEGKMSWDELYVLLVNRVKYIRKQGTPYNISLDTRVVQSQQSRKRAAPTGVEGNDRGAGVLHLKEGVVATSGGASSVAADSSTQQDCQEIRYFSEAYNCLDTLTAAVKQSPKDVSLWIKLAQLKLSHKSPSPKTLSEGENAGSGEEKQKANLMQALNTLSRGLEANSHSEDLWLEYLHLYSQQGSFEELVELCEQALEFVPSAYSIWCHYLDSLHTYSDKRSVCLRLINHLTEYEDVTDVLSHRMLESVLYLVQLDLYTGQLKTALAVIQGALGKRKPSPDDDIGTVTHRLTPGDVCLMWLAYIHVFEFHRLPPVWYDPNYGMPSRMTSRTLFVFPWQPGKGTKAPSEKLLGMFHDALRACTACKKKASDKVMLCLPLYRNLLALEMAHTRHDSAKGICRRLLQGTPVGELWLCLATLEEITGGPVKTGEVYEEAMEKMHHHAKIAYSAARFYLEQNNSGKAVECLVQSIKAKYVDTVTPTPTSCDLTTPTTCNTTSPSSEVKSTEEATVDPDPVLLYRKILSQPLPYDIKTQTLKVEVNKDTLGDEEVYLWLCYCLLLELTPHASPLCTQYNLSAESAYETAVHSMVSRAEVETLWLEYLFYMRDRVSSRDTPEGVKALDDLVNRSLVSVSTVTSRPYSTSHIQHDFSFHNQVISLYLSHLPSECRSQFYAKYHKWLPADAQLVLKACEHEITIGNPEQAKKFAVQYLADHPACTSLLQMYC